MTPLQSQPDTKYSYSNAGTNTAARILEVVTGQPYAEFLAQRLLEPLGLRDTTFWPSRAQLRRLPKAYKPDAAKTGLEEMTIAQLRAPFDDRSRMPLPAGGLFSTAQDMARFGQMILQGGTLDGRRYLSPAAVHAMTTKQTGPGVTEGYGFGWQTGEDWYGHSGALSTNLTLHRSRGLITVFLVHHAGFPGNGGQCRDVFTQAALALPAGTEIAA